MRKRFTSRRAEPQESLNLKVGLIRSQKDTKDIKRIYDTLQSVFNQEANCTTYSQVGRNIRKN